MIMNGAKAWAPFILLHPHFHFHTTSMSALLLLLSRFFL